MKNEKEFRENCVVYLLDAMDKKEQEKFEHFLQHAGKEYHDILRAYRDIVMQLPLSVKQHPPEHIRQQILDAVQKSAVERRSQFEQQKEASETSRLWKLHRGLGLHKPATGLATLAALFLFGFGLLIYNYMLHQHLDEQQDTVMELQNELADTGEYLSILESRQLEYVRLDGTDHVTAAFGKLICDLSRKRALLQMSNLPPLPEDKMVQLWVIKNGQAVNKGRVDIGDNRMQGFFLFEEFEIEDMSQNDDLRFTVTLEPETGRTEPSGEILMSGSPVVL